MCKTDNTVLEDMGKRSKVVHNLIITCENIKYIFKNTTQCCQNLKFYISFHLVISYLGVNSAVAKDLCTKMIVAMLLVIVKQKKPNKLQTTNPPRWKYIVGRKLLNTMGQVCTMDYYVAILKNRLMLT